MVRQTAKVIFLEILAVLGIVSILLAAGLAIRLSSGPMDIGLIKGDIENALEAARDGREVSLDAVSLQWESEENRAVIVASDLKFFDDTGTLAAEAGRAELQLDIARILFGRVRLLGLVLEDGWINVSEEPTGWTIAGDPIGVQSGEVLAPGELEPTKMLGFVNQALADILTTLRDDSEHASLQLVRVNGLDLVFQSAGVGERARLADAFASIERGAFGIRLNVSGRSAGRVGAPGGFALALDVPGDYGRIDTELAFVDWSLESVAAWFPMLAGRITGLGSDVTLAFGANAETGLEEVRFGANAEAGEIMFGAAPMRVDKLALEGSYAPKTDQLTVHASDFDVGPASGALTLDISDVLSAEAERAFAIDAPALQLDLTPVFSEAWPLRQVLAKGHIDLANREAQFDQFRLRVDNAELQANGRIKALRSVNAPDSPFETDLSFEVTGELSPQEFLRFWPVKLGTGARAYVTRSLLGGLITGGTAQLNLRRDSLTEGHIADDALRAGFELTGARVKPLPDLPIVEGANIVGAMTGNSLDINFSGGTFEDWTINTGGVSYPRLSPAGADMTITANGTGPAQSLMRIVSDSRLQLQARTGFDPGNVSGDAEMSFELVRPALPDTPISAFRYSGEGIVRNGGLAEAFNGLALTDSDAKVSLDETGISIGGFGALAGSPLQYDWSYKFGGQNTLADLKATSIVNPDILNAFGIVGRAYLSGDVPVELDAKLAGTALRSVDAVFDLLGARLDVAEVNWIKPAGQAATATVRYSRDEDGAPATHATLLADDAEFDGTFTLEPNGRLVAANIERAFLKDRAELTGTARRTDADGLLFQLDATYLDLSRVVAGFSRLSDASGTASRIGDVALQANIDRLRLREGFDASDMQLSLISSREGLQTLDAVGKLPNRADISAAYDASGLGDPTFLINSGDAGFLASVFLGTEALENGTLQLSGTFSAGDLPTQVRLVIEDGRLKDAPFITQILSLASIRGVSDTLSGEGVLFSIIEVPLTLSAGRFNIVGARASGPALGLTANGSITPQTGAIDIDGVLVPSFGINSALGGLPIIGDLFVSREGEGVISLRYGIKGTLDRAQVSVNPLSAVTPGVLRRIFENPAETELPPVEPEERPATIPGE